MNKASVIGVGSLGSCIAYEIARRGIVDELILIDKFHELAEGNATDINQALAFTNDVRVKAGDYKDANNSRVIIVTAGKPRTRDMMSRIDLLMVNKKIIEDVALNIKRLSNNPIIVTLTNPVDIMNYVMWNKTELNRMKVLGSAGMLDSSRFRTVLRKKYKIPILDIESYVIGQHGDNQVPVFSRTRIEGEKKNFNRQQRTEIISKLRQSALEVISKKGATVYAPANNTVNIVQSILKDEKKLCICSVVLDGEYGLKDVSIGVPVKIGFDGVEKILEWDLYEEEKNILYQGAQKLKELIQSIIQ
jgi:malate dehydrogenase